MRYQRSESSLQFGWDEIDPGSRRSCKNNRFHLFFRPVLTHRNIGAFVAFNRDEPPNRIRLNDHNWYDLPL